jgi:hypothetical protein
VSLAPYFVIPLSVSGALTTGVKPVAPGQNVYAPTVRDTADIAVFQAGDTIGLDVIEIGSTVAGSDLVVSLAFQKL